MLFRSEPRVRPLLAGVLVLLPVAWIGPDWIGSGMPLDGGAQARLSLQKHKRLRRRIGYGHTQGNASRC